MPFLPVAAVEFEDAATTDVELFAAAAAPFAPFPFFPVALVTAVAADAVPLANACKFWNYPYSIRVLTSFLALLWFTGVYLSNI